jgi:hypothetical protein
VALLARGKSTLGWKHGVETPGRAHNSGTLSGHRDSRGKEGKDNGSRIISRSQMTIIIQDELECAAIYPTFGPDTDYLISGAS